MELAICCCSSGRLVAGGNIFRWRALERLFGIWNEGKIAEITFSPDRIS
jgi:hypothetical protein